LNGHARYIVIEGIDGAGKTELAERLVPSLIQRGHAVSRLREPTDAFLRAQGARMLSNDPIGAALCFTVDRAMLRPEVERCLERGEIVVQDRSFYSTLAYQGARLDEATVREIERIERSVAREPDVVLFLDLPVNEAMGRIAHRGRADIFEDAAYLEAVRQRFERLFEPPRWVRVDARAPPAALRDQAMRELMARGL
jgi:dTMP kinase